MLLICPVRPGDVNEELRFAIRSWETNLHYPGGLELMTVGYQPSWLAPDVHIPGNHYKSMPLAVFDNVFLGAEAAVGMGAGEVLYMNDDFYCLDPMGSVLPVRRNCTLAQHIEGFPGNAGLWWPRSLRLTASWLAEEGFPHPDSYEVHRPLLATPSGMYEALGRWLERPDSMAGDVPQWRTVYGTLNKVDAYPVKDAKLGLHATGIGTPWLSTSDQSWRRHAPSIKKRFQKPSRWEV
jgi:hypothetical protein